MLKIRRSLGRLIFNMGIAIPGKTVFLIETAPSTFNKLNTKNSTDSNHWNVPCRVLCSHWLSSRPSQEQSVTTYDDVIKWKPFPRYWPFVHRSLVVTLTKASDAELWCFLWSASKQKVGYIHSRRRWFETPSRPSWHHGNESNQRDHVSLSEREINNVSSNFTNMV